MLPVSAAEDDPTLIEENDQSSTFVLGDPETDGEYVVWANDGTSVHSFCQSVWVTRIDDPDPVYVTTIEQTSEFAVDDGLLLVVTPAVRCQDNSGDQLTPGLFLIDLETLESRTLFDDVENVTHVAIDNPYVAWMTTESLDEGKRLTIRAMDTTSDDPPVEVTSEIVEAGGFAGLYLEADTVYWATSYGTAGVGNAARAKIGESPTYFMSIHDSTTVDIRGDTMVTMTEGRPLFHNLATGETRWLDEPGANGVITDGRFVFWTMDGSDYKEVFAYDSLTGARFLIWRIMPEDPARPGYVSTPAARDGVVVWSRYSYNDWMSAIHGTRVADRLPSAHQPDPGTTNPDWTYYAESGHYLANDFRAFWTQNGGLPVFGYPMTEEFDYLGDDDAVFAAQMTERQRFEWHPENAGTPYAVLLGRLGETILEQQGRDWTTFAKADPSAGHYFAETGHAIAPEFYGFWSSHGLDLGYDGTSFEESVALFGYPLSEPMPETNADGDTVLTQYFERAVFEYHPDNAEPSQVLLRRLGAELLDAWGW
jgi:hypothetical protein